MTPVRGNDAVFGGDTIFKTNRDGFLQQNEQTAERTTRNTCLSDGEMAETTDELGFIEGVGGHFHATHGLHVLVHFDELILLYLDFERGRVASVGAEGVLV